MAEKRGRFREYLAAGLVAGMTSGDVQMQESARKESSSEPRIEVEVVNDRKNEIETSHSKNELAKKIVAPEKKKTPEQLVRDIRGALQVGFGPIHELRPWDSTKVHREILQKMHPGDLFSMSMTYDGKTYFIVRQLVRFDPDQPMGGGNPEDVAVVNIIHDHRDSDADASDNNKVFVSSGQHAYTSEEALESPDIDLEFAFELYGDTETLKQKSAEMRKFYSLYDVIENPPELEQGDITVEQLDLYIDKLEQAEAYPWTIGVHPGAMQKVADRLQEYRALRERLESE